LHVIRRQRGAGRADSWDEAKHHSEQRLDGACRLCRALATGAVEASLRRAHGERPHLAAIDLVLGLVLLVGALHYMIFSNIERVAKRINLTSLSPRKSSSAYS
jgi:hypothetical protein